MAAGFGRPVLTWANVISASRQTAVLPQWSCDHLCIPLEDNDWRRRVGQHSFWRCGMKKSRTGAGPGTPVFVIAIDAVHHVVAESAVFNTLSQTTGVHEQHYHSAAFRQYLCHTLFLVCWKYRFCPTNLRKVEGYNRSTKKSTKLCCFVFCKNFFTLQRQRLYERCDSRSIHFSFTRGNFVPTLFYSSPLYPKKGL